MGSLPQRMNLSHDGSTLYVALNGSGDVVFVDLATNAITKIDVETALGDQRAFDIIEGAPGRVFVTGNPNSNGLAFVTMIRTDQGNAVSRFLFPVVREQPVLPATGEHRNA